MKNFALIVIASGCVVAAIAHPAVTQAKKMASSPKSSAATEPKEEVGEIVLVQYRAVTVGPGGRIYQTIPTPGGSVTIGPGGKVLHMTRTPGGSVTVGPKGEIYNTTRTTSGSVTVGPKGRIYNTTRTPGGSVTVGPNSMKLTAAHLPPTTVCPCGTSRSMQPSGAVAPVLNPDALQAALRLSVCTPSMNSTPARTSEIRWAALIRRHRFWAISSSLNAMSNPFTREPAPLVTRCRSRTVAKGDSITLVVRRCCQCSAGKSKKVSRSASHRRSEATAFGYFAS